VAIWVRPIHVVDFGLTDGQFVPVEVGSPRLETGEKMKNLKLEMHFAATAALCLAGAASADVITWNINAPIPNNIDGLYINIASQTTGSSGGTTAGWDINPYGTNAMQFYASASSPNPATTYVRTQGSGGPSSLAVGHVIGGSSAYTNATTAVISTTNAVSIGWQLNAINYFGFRFNPGSTAGVVRYGFGAMQVGATASARTLLFLKWEDSGASITVGSGGPPPAYDPCATTNPTIANGANSNYYRADAANLAPSCGTIFGANYYKFTPGDSGSYTFESCVSGAGVKMAVMSGCDAFASELACGAPACGGLGSSATVTLTAGVPVYVLAGGSSASSGLTTSVSVAVTPPPIGACVNALVAGYGDNAFNTGVGNNGAQVVQSNLANTATATIQKSLWFAFTPTATGQFAFKTCGANGDTMLAIGTTCPGAGSRFNTIAYNDDAPLCSSGGTANLASFIDATNNGATGSFAGFPLTQDLVAGTTYYICLGQYSSSATSTVAGSLNISGPEGSACDGDFNSDGTRDGADLGSLLASFGVDAGGDMDGDGITNGADLGALLAIFGTPCP
jgi:hypothetical protein